ncbi:unannotated protein [freshwater metagenome]|uniref:Unannotated protein n=1 Tax=freshwater metagenome TaxID=449393 RepID=A0A6J7C8S8_9ZZZZ
MPIQRGLDVLLTEREPDLAQVTRVRPQHLDLSGGETGSEHEPIEAVDLHRSGKLGEKCALHLIPGGVRHVGTLGHLHADIVQPHTRLRQIEVERTLVDGPETEVVEQGQQVGDRDGTTGAIHTKAPLAGPGFGEVHHRRVGRGRRRVRGSARQAIDDREID